MSVGSVRRISPRSIPAEKCLPVEDTTRARTVPSLSSSRTASGSSVQNSRVIVLSSSGRLKRRWATLPTLSISKVVAVTGTPW